MNRSNVGNVVTNGTQILSVGATTAGGLRRRLAHAEDSLNNKTNGIKDNYSLDFLEPNFEDKAPEKINQRKENLDFLEPSLEFDDKAPEKLDYEVDLSAFNELDSEQKKELLLNINNNIRYRR